MNRARLPCSDLLPECQLNTRCLVSLYLHCSGRKVRGEFWGGGHRSTKRATMAVGRRQSALAPHHSSPVLNDENEE